MISHELLLLGLLKEGPKHGYQIKKEIRGILSISAGIDLKSIYYPLRLLESKKLVTRRTIIAKGRPVRYVFELTPRGEARFNVLLSQSFLDFKRPQFSLDLSLYFLRYIAPRIARRRLRARIFILTQLSKGIQQLISSFDKNDKKKASSLTLILNHNLQMLQAEARFLARLIKTL